MDLLLMGDFNIDFKKSNDAHVKKMQGFMSNYTLEQVIQSTTRVGLNCESTLDLMITNLKFIAVADSFNLNLSDHLPTLLVYKKEREKICPRTFTCRDYSKANLENYAQALSQHDWTFVYGETNIEVIWEEMFEIFTSKLDTFCPYKTVSVKRDRPAYITREIIDIGKERDRLFKIARKSNIESDWVTARKQRQRVNYALKRAKAEFYKSLLVETRGDSRKFWGRINDLLPKKKSPSISIITNQETGCDLEGTNAANYINHFFCSVGDKLVSQLPRKHHPLDMPKEVIRYHYIWSNSLSEKQVKDEVKNIDVNKSSGFIEINARCLKIGLMQCIPEFTYILNSCIDSCIIPGSWKAAIVVPILKQGNPKFIDNLRPISLIPITGKVFERFINNFIMDFME